MISFFVWNSVINVSVVWISIRSVTRTLFTFYFDRRRENDNQALKYLPLRLDWLAMKLHSLYNEVLRKNNCETIKKELSSMYWESPVKVVSLENQKGC